MTRGSIESQLEDGMKFESSGPCLHVSPIAPDIENINERQAGESFHVLLERFQAISCSKRGPTFLPCIANQTETIILYRLVGLRGYQHGIPTFVLLDAEWALVQTVRHTWSR